VPPFHLLRFHGAMLWVTGRIALRAFFPRRAHTIAPIQPVRRIIAAPAPPLVAHYLRCCDASDKYTDSLPPHMVSQWGLPIIAQLLLQTPFNLTRVLNQGVTLHVNGALPRNQPLHCFGQIQSLSEESNRTRVSVLLQTGTAEQPDLVAAVLHMVFIHNQQAGKKKYFAPVDEIEWESKGSWSANEKDGLLFALATGDFNPIHWLSLAGKMSALQHKILHGFATFARSYEQLNTRPIRQIDLRFLRPVPLPSGALQVEQSVEQLEGVYQIRLRGADQQMHLAGSVSYQ